MKVILIIVITGIAFVNTSNIPDGSEVITKDDERNITVNNSSEERQWMRPIFPKRSQKFSLTTKSSRARNVTSPVTRSSKKPMFRIVSKAVKMKNKSYWKTATKRPSLMKNLKFTINPVTRFNIHRNSKSLNDQSNEDDSSDETLETIKGNEKHKEKIKNMKTLIHRFHNLQSKIIKDKNVENISKPEKITKKLNKSKDITTTRYKPSESEFSSEENEDRKEFIFVTPKKIKEDAVGVAEVTGETSEATTMMLENESKLRPKRSINVIEEENLGTTVSGFKFTGKPASMSNDIVFRNINT